MPATPISELTYVCRPATGHDDVALLEAETSFDAAILLASWRVSSPGGERLNARALPVGDLDAIVVELRRTTFGERIVAEGNCDGCGAAIDIAFGLAAFAAHHVPRRPRNVAVDDDGWWTLRGDGLAFRLPTADDVYNSADSPDPAAALAAACIRGELTASQRRRADRAMAALAPTLAAEVQARCPECERPVPLWVDLRELCLADLRFVAAAVLEQVHLLAETYHWQEDAILAMPSSRRAAYADCIRASRGAPLGAEALGG